MLVLSRKQNQEIIIGDNIKITVLKMKGNTVRLGIEAPREVNVLRGELPKMEPAIHSDESANDPTSSPAAKFTVVFSNSNELQTPQVDVIPFQTEEKPNSRTKAPIQDHQSIQFQGNLPTALQHNRLKEIVSKLTSKADPSNV